MIATLALASTVLAIMSYNILNTKEEPPPKQAGETASADLCIRQTLTFDRAAKAVTFVRTKINREGACSMVQDEPLTLFLGEPL